jgi:hypothetical protein
VTATTVQLEITARNGIADAPVDGKQYARKDGAWDEVEEGDTSKWEADGAGYIKPKTSNLVKVANIEGAKIYAGFVNRTDSTIAIDASGVFTLSKVAASFRVWVNGVKFDLTTSQTVTVTEDQNLTFIYIDSSGVLQKSTSAWDLTSGLTAPVAIVFKDGTNYAKTDERHGYERNKAWHNWAHFNIGAMYRSGLTGTFANATLSVTQGVIADEDIVFDTEETKTTASLWYRNGASGMRMIRSSSTPYYQSGGVIYYDNNSGTLQPVTNNRYTTVWVYASNDPVEPIYVVVGQNNDVNVATARNAERPTINLSTAEWKLIYRVIYRNLGGAATYIEAADFRTVQTGTPTTAITTDHAALINRDALNSHPATAISVDASGFNGNLATTDDTVQKVAQKLDDLTVSASDYFLKYTVPSDVVSVSITTDGDGVNLNIPEGKFVMMMAYVTGKNAASGLTEDINLAFRVNGLTGSIYYATNSTVLPYINLGGAVKNVISVQCMFYVLGGELYGNFFTHSKNKAGSLFVSLARTFWTIGASLTSITSISLGTEDGGTRIMEGNVIYLKYI